MTKLKTVTMIVCISLFFILGYELPKHFILPIPDGFNAEERKHAEIALYNMGFTRSPSDIVITAERVTRVTKLPQSECTGFEWKHNEDFTETWQEYINYDPYEVIVTQYTLWGLPYGTVTHHCTGVTSYDRVFENFLN